MKHLIKKKTVLPFTSRLLFSRFTFWQQSNVKFKLELLFLHTFIVVVLSCIVMLSLILCLELKDKLHGKYQMKSNEDDITGEDSPG